MHGAGYADYSHGVRLVSAIAYVNGQPRSLLDVLQDPWLAGIVSDEGPIIRLAGLIAAASAPATRRIRATGAPSRSRAELACRAATEGIARAVR